MLRHNYFYRVVKLGGDGTIDSFLGSAFAVRPNGGLMTCRHVVDVPLDDGCSIAVLDNSTSKPIPVPMCAFDKSGLDIAMLLDVLPGHQHYLPFLTPKDLLVGKDVYSYGFFSATGEDEGDIQTGYFKGNIVNFQTASGGKPYATMSLSYPVIEGLSGSPVLTYHNGPKVVGLAVGNKQSRVVAHEVHDYEDSETRFKETIQRVVELGQAYHPATIQSWLVDHGLDDVVFSSERVEGVDG